MSSVKLINYSQPPKEAGSFMFINAIKSALTTYEDEVKDEITQQVAHCARVSNPSNQHNTKTSQKLLDYLMEHKHWSPFEMVSVCLEIDTTRDIARQILRHRSFSFQEFSQRYADPTTDLGFVTREARLQDTQNRQNSIGLIADRANHQQIAGRFEDLCRKMALVSEEAYRQTIELGVAKEQARVFLPEGLTRSRMYMNGTLRSWIHYIDLRSGPETQKEHRQVAIQCAEAIENIFPGINTFVNNS